MGNPCNIAISLFSSAFSYSIKHELNIKRKLTVLFTDNIKASEAKILLHNILFTSKKICFQLILRLIYHKAINLPQID